MAHFVTGSQRVWRPFATFCAIATLVGLSQSAQAQDARTKARNTIAQLKANIAKATTQIADRTRRITAGDILIIAAEVAVREAEKKKDNDLAIGALRLSLAALKSKKNALVKEKLDWERYRASQQKLLIEWETHLRKLGG